MKVMSFASLISKRYLPLVLVGVSLAVLAVIVWLVLSDMRPRPEARSVVDAPPEVSFTWTPLGPLTLREFKGLLTLKDDHALDFATYKFRIVELDKTIGLPIEGLIGKEYSSDIYLSWLADNSQVLQSSSLTFEISVSDDRGQNTSITRVARLKESPTELKLQAP